MRRTADAGGDHYGWIADAPHTFLRVNRGKRKSWLMIDPEVKWVRYVDDLPQINASPFVSAMSAYIGERGREGAEQFQILVCNTAWFQERLRAEPGIWPRGCLVVDQIEVNHVKDCIQALADSFCRSSDWATFGERMNRYLLWEYQDFDDFQGEVTVPWPRKR